MTYRIMRKSLLKGFDEIYVLNLSDNSNINVENPSVFGAKQEVFINIFVNKTVNTEKTCIYYCDNIGARENVNLVF
ncbi:MAG: hypothetical protein LBI98_01985 [Endomicrobium sp.]|nr:hypothetical protein [Endomicrobium sp.]